MMISKAALQPEYPLGKMLSVLGRGYLQLLRNRLQQFDIDRNYYALVLIENHSRALSQQELAALLGSDKVSIVRVVDYLSENGYLKRVRKSDDRRKYNLELTEKARSIIPEIRKSYSEVNNVALSGFTDAEILFLLESLEKIRFNLTQTVSAL